MRLPLVILPLLITGCATPQPVMSSLPTASIQAKVETQPVGTLDDAADDPAIWRNAERPEASLIVATDKKAGIHVYDLKGGALGFTPAPRLNNVDLRDGVMIGGQRGVIVAASDRLDIMNAKIMLFRLDTSAQKLVSLGAVPVGPGEAYGMCLWNRRSDNALFGFVVMKDGRIDQVALDLSGAQPTGRVVRRMKLGTQSEGCVVDDRTGQLYVAEEDVGLWRFGADPSAPTQAIPITKADGTELVIDVEGLAIAAMGADGGYLVASSQGDNAYAIYRLPDLGYVGRFRLGDGGVDGTQETDGIELILGDFGPDFRSGLFVAQDGNNAPDTQNFKLADWGDVIRALELK
ncbi:MAG: phytase [Sphingorhabdus sp.]